MISFEAILCSRVICNPANWEQSQGVDCQYTALESRSQVLTMSNILMEVPTNRYWIISQFLLKVMTVWTIVIQYFCFLWKCWKHSGLFGIITKCLWCKVCVWHSTHRKRVPVKRFMSSVEIFSAVKYATTYQSFLRFRVHRTSRL